MTEPVVAHLYPNRLSKYLVDDIFVVTVELQPKQEEFEFELYSGLNRANKTYAFSSVNNKYYVRIKLNQSGFFTWKIRYRLVGSTSWKWLKIHDKLVAYDVQVDPAWLQDAIIYNVFVRFFNGKVSKNGAVIKPGEGGTFDDVKDRLDELKHMGINTLYFNPIHLIGELYRKHNMLDHLPAYFQPGSPYSIKDYKSIDPELTYDRDTKKFLTADPQQEFRELIEAAHSRYMHVIMDLVFNHTAHDFIFQRIRPEWFLYKQNITSLDEPYLYPQDMKHGKPWGDPKHTMSPYDHGVWWEDAAQLNWEYMLPKGANQPPRNTTLKEMWEYFKSIPQYWINHFGVDGFRCDIAYRVPVKFWKACIAESRELAQKTKNNLANDVVFIAEAYTDNLAELQQAGFSAVYGDYSHKLTRPIDLKGYLDYIYNISGEHFPVNSRWFIFPESHDFGRTPQKILGHKVANHREDLKANQSRWLLTATLPGLPLIFNGFEKVEWHPVNLFSYGAVDWEKDTDLRDFIGKVNDIRKRHVALQKGNYTFLMTNQGISEQTQIFAFIRVFRHQAIIVVVNMDVCNQTGPTIVYLPEQFKGDYSLKDLLHHKTYLRNGRELIVTLPAGDAHIFLVNHKN